MSLLTVIRKGKAASVHPLDTPVAQEQFKPKSEFCVSSYDGLNDQSPWSHYAWAFLRRNRFFQAGQDGIYGAVDVDYVWGYKSREGALGSHGVRNYKSYTENAVTGEPILWDCWHELSRPAYENLHDEEAVDDSVVTSEAGSDDDMTCWTQIFPTYRFSEHHLIFVLRADDMYGPGIDAIPHQLSIVKHVLELRREVLGRAKKDPGLEKVGLPKSPKRADMRRLIYLADVVTPTLTESRTPRTIQEICARIGCIIYEIDAASAEDRMRTMNNRVGDDLRMAFNMIYKAGYLSLLRLEDPAAIVDLTRTSDSDQ